MAGYNGKMLWIDLENCSIKSETLEENFYRQYAGNGVLAAYYLMTRTPIGCDPYGTENLLMFMSGAANGQEGPGLARFTVCGKSPVTGGIGEASSEGPFAIALKRTGYDGIAISGIANRPSVLLIDDGKVELLPADDLWGKKISETTDILEARYPGAHVAAIGPAGERRVRFANIISDRCHQASRSGMGSVMGAKKLKAVVLRGGRLPEVADPVGMEALRQRFESRIKDNPLAMWQKERPGFGVWIHTHGIDASVCVDNYQSATCNYLNNFTPDAFAPYYQGVAYCPGCALDCIKCYSDTPKDAASGGLHQEIAGSMGPNIGNDSAETVVRANILCNEYGMDPNSAGYVISFAQESVQRGLLDPGELNLAFDGKNDVLKLLEQIANRDGLGELLAEGSAIAAKKIGHGAENYALTVKGNEMVAFEPRSQTNLALGYATSPIGPRYEICEHDWDFDLRVGWPHTLNYCRTIGIRERIPMEYLGRDKVRNFKALSTLWSAEDALGICLFACAPTRILSLPDLAQLIHCITGWETSDYEVMRFGLLRLHLYRLYNLREGLSASDDTLPKRFFEESIDCGMHTGTHLNREEFRACIQTYYGMMGWDADGVPTQETLLDFGLDWAIA